MHVTGIYIYIPWNIRSKCRYTVYIYPYPWSYEYNYIDMYLNVCKKDCAWLLWVCLVFMPAMMHKVGLPTWMSQEVTKSLASGLYLQYTPFISRWNKPLIRSPLIHPQTRPGKSKQSLSFKKRHILWLFLRPMCPEIHSAGFGVDGFWMIYVGIILTPKINMSPKKGDDVWRELSF